MNQWERTMANKIFTITSKTLFWSSVQLLVESMSKGSMGLACP